MARLAKWQRIRVYGLVAALWLGANLVALAAIDIYESRTLEKEFCVPAGVIWQFEDRRCVALADQSVSWYRFRPPSLWAGRHSVPLVVFLHGAGQRGNDNVRQFRFLPVVLSEES